MERTRPLVLEQSPLGQAIGYALRHRVALSRYLEDGRLPIDNNSVYAARGINRVMPTSGLCRVCSAVDP
jgi:hypothetical protein